MRPEAVRPQRSDIDSRDISRPIQGRHQWVRIRPFPHLIREVHEIVGSRANLTYEELVEEAGRLNVQQQLLLLEALAAEVRRNLASRAGTVSILDLKGLGKGAWDGIDADQHLERERASWDG